MHRFGRFAVAVMALTMLFAGGAQAAEVTAATKELFAQNMYHEARSGGREAMVAVGWVVLNRTKHKSFPNTIDGVITAGADKGRCQFGWYCHKKEEKPAAGKLWEEARTISDEMLGSSPPADPTKGAVWFQESWRKQPGWMKKSAKKTVTIGGNTFYALKKG